VISLHLPLPLQGMRGIQLLPSCPERVKINEEGTIHAPKGVLRGRFIAFFGSSSPAKFNLCYSLGVNSFYQKPISYEGWVQFVKTIRDNGL